MILQNGATTRSSVSCWAWLPFRSVGGSWKINDECARDNNFVSLPGGLTPVLVLYCFGWAENNEQAYIWRGRDKSVVWRVFIGLELSAQSESNGKIKSSRRRVGAWRLLKSALWWMCGPVGARVSCFFERVWRRHTREIAFWVGATELFGW